MILSNYFFFSFDFNPLSNNNFLDINKYLMKGKKCEIMFGIIIKNIVSLSNIDNASNHTNCALLSSQKCITQYTQLME